MSERYYPPIDYTSRDWRSVREDLLDAARTILPEWTSRSPSDFGVVMVEAFAYAADILSFYTDRAAGEAFLRTAVQRRSVLDIAQMLNYTPAKGTAARTTLRFTVQPDVGEVLIPKCTRVSTSGGSTIVYFELDDDLVINSAVATVGEMTATEGQTYELEGVGVSNGTAGQIYPLAHSPVIAGTIQVVVDEGGGFQRWREVETLLEGDPADSIFVVSEDELGRTLIQFGDDITGRIPAINAVVKVSYRVGGGLRGNVPADTLTLAVNSLPGVVAITNPQAATGGADAESLTSIRENAPRAHRTSQRAVSLTDHADIALLRAEVAKANAIQAADFTALNRHVEVFVAPSTPTVLDNAVLQDVEDFISSRAVQGSEIDVYNATYVPVNVSAQLFVADGYLAASVKTVVEATLNQLLAYDTAQMAARVPLSKVYRAILSVEGVDYATITTLDAPDARNSGAAVDLVTDSDEVPVAGTFTLTTSGGV